jgi:Putative Flp pilus-assembly TadE/G-like
MAVSTPERGQAVPLLLVVLVLATAAAVLVAELGVASTERIRAQTAADATALAGAVDGPRRAEQVAAANGASLEAYRDRDGTIEVLVRYRRARAVAAAEAASTGGDRTGVAPVVVAALARAEGLLGRPVPILSSTGIAVEVPADVAVDLAAISAATGLCQLWPPGDPVHFGPCPPTPPR